MSAQAAGSFLSFDHKSPLSEKGYTWVGSRPELVNVPLRFWMGWSPQLVTASGHKSGFSDPAADEEIAGQPSHMGPIRNLKLLLGIANSACQLLHRDCA